jgi:hypothetical protein
MCPNTVDEGLGMVPKLPAPDSITVKPDGKYWRIVGTDMGSRRMDVSSVVEREKAFWEQVA